VFIDAAGETLAYTDPWVASVEDRLQALVAAERHLAYYCEEPNAHTFRYRVFNMVQALEAQPALGISAAWFARRDLEATLDFVDRADALVISGTRYDDKIGQMIARARARGIPVFYDIDDLIFDIRYAHQIGDTIDRSLQCSEEWDWWLGYIGRLGLTLQYCDEAITTNAFLAERISEFAPGVKVKVIPNFLNQMQTSVSRTIYERKSTGLFRRDGRIHIGYFSGTNTHGKDFGIVAGTLGRLLDREESVDLHLVGSLIVPSELQRHADRVKSHPMQDFVNLQRHQGSVEIVIAPLQENVFTNCKSELKYFEAAIVGTIVVASPTFAFRHAISDGESGFLALPHEWDAKLDRALALLDGDGSAYGEMANLAHEHVEERYSWLRQGGRIAAEIFGGTAAHPRGLVEAGVATS
jgi:glycosyltransferase involved in cell wall biosynthesis